MSCSGDSDDTARERIDALNRKLIDEVVRPLGLDAGLDVAEVFKSLTASVAQDTEHWLEIQNSHYRRQLELWASLALPQDAAPASPAMEPNPADRRFRAPEWRKEPYFEYLARSYLLASQWLSEVVASAKLEPHAKRKLEFFARQFVDAMSPANFPWSNPEVLRLAAETDATVWSTDCAISPRTSKEAGFR
jgi:polyhydroxyalkanoate synthase subunit PhaC